ncbi:MAG TPA: XdhC/CoxI family protein [Actinocrinis sp.]|nr:XdhC/CoxI family protein [Actinocrinis sp.]
MSELSEMRALADTLRCWHDKGSPYALATVVAVTGSAPRGVGAALAVDEGGNAAGSVSGGCVEGEVYELCREVLRTGERVRRRFEADAGNPFAPALVCGGALDVEVVRVDPRTDPTALAGIEAHIAATRGRAPRLIVVGAVEFAAALIRMAKFLGYQTTVCDARPVFATPDRFPGADEIVVEWPHRYLAETDVQADTAICVLTHDAKFDVPALVAALRSPAAYVGAVGSRRTCADRVERLRAAGVTEAELARLRSPIGLDLGGREPEHVALAIGAEIVALAHGGTGRPLRDTGGPLHTGATGPVPPPTPTHLVGMG